MKVKYVWIALGEAAVVLILIGIIFSMKGAPDTAIKHPEIKTSEKLLSPRVYAGVLQPKSYLIFNFDPLENNLRDVIHNNRNISIYVENLRDGASLNINGNQTYPAASLNKVPIAILIMKKVEDGRLSLGSMIDIRDEDRLSSSGELYKTSETKLPLRTLLEAMLKDSDNTAYRTLLRMVTLDDIQYLSNYLDYYAKNLTGEVQRNENKDIDLVATDSMYHIFASLYLSTILEPEYSDYVLNLLANTSFDIYAVAGIPRPAIIAQKHGVNYKNGNKVFHSCGIMYINESKIFYCAMTRDLEQTDAMKVIGSVVHEIYVYILDTRHAIDSDASQGKI